MTTSYTPDSLLLSLCSPLPGLVLLRDRLTLCPLTRRDFAGVNEHSARYEKSHLFQTPELPELSTDSEVVSRPDRTDYREK